MADSSASPLPSFPPGSMATPKVRLFVALKSKTQLRLESSLGSNLGTKTPQSVSSHSRAACDKSSVGRSAQFATPNVCLFRSPTHNNMSASPLLSESSHNRTSTSLQHNETRSVQTCTANSRLAPQSHTAASSLHSLSSSVDLTNRPPESTVDACQENTFTKDADGACAVTDICFHKPSTPPQS